MSIIRGKQSPQEAVQTLLPSTMPPTSIPSIPSPTLLVPLASRGVEVMTEEVQRETLGVLSNNKFQPQTARDKMRLMFEQKEAQRKESSSTRSKKTKKADGNGGKENSAKRKVAKPRKKKGAKTTPHVESDQDDEDSSD